MLFDYSFPCCHLGLLGCPHSCPFRAVLLPWLMSIGFEYFDTSSLSDNFNYFLLVSSLSSEPLRPRTVEHFRSNTCFSAWRALFGLHLSHRQTRSSVFSPLLSCRDFRVMLFKFQYMIHFNFASVWNCVVFFSGFVSFSPLISTEHFKAPSESSLSTSTVLRVLTSCPDLTIHSRCQWLSIWKILYSPVMSVSLVPFLTHHSPSLWKGLTFLKADKLPWFCLPGLCLGCTLLYPCRVIAQDYDL